jgi:hypothetical protein
MENLPPLPAATPFHGSPAPVTSLTLNIDNRSAIDMATAKGPTKRSKHIGLAHHFINDEVHSGSILPRCVPTAKQKADFPTKPLKRILHIANLALMRAPSKNVLTDST